MFAEKRNVRRSRKGRKVFAVASALFLMPAGPAHAQCEVDKLTDPAGDPDNQFGIVAMDGDVAVVGDPNWPEAGRAWVYRRLRGEWRLEQQLTNPFAAPGDTFGISVAVSGDIAVVGAGSADAEVPFQGAVHVYRYRSGTPRDLGSQALASSGQWVHEARLLAFDGASFDFFGFSVAGDEDVIAVGARDDDHQGMQFVGSVYVFRHEHGRWRHEAKLVDPDGEEGDGFGISVALKDKTLIVGSIGNDDAGFGTGAAFAFRRVEQEWVLEAQLTAADAKWQAWFGYSVSMSISATEEVVAIGAPEDESQNGAVYIFRRDSFGAPDSWVQEVKLLGSKPVGPFPFFGSSVSLSEDGRSLVIGAPGDYAEGPEAGAVYVFRRVDGQWEEIKKLVALDGGSVQEFGTSVAVSEDYALVRSLSGSDNVHVIAGVAGIDCDGDGIADACAIAGGTARDDDHDGIPDECQEPDADVDGDGDVDFADLILLLDLWGPCPPAPSCPGDLDGDGYVGLSDLLTLLFQWS